MKGITVRMARKLITTHGWKAYQTGAGTIDFVRGRVTWEVSFIGHESIRLQCSQRTANDLTSR